MRLLLGVWFAAVAVGCTPIEADRVYGKDLAAAHARFATLPAELDFGAAPVAGARRTIRTLELERIAREHHLSIEPGTELCFERTTMLLEGDSLRETLAVALGRPGEIEVLDYSRTPLPMGRLEFRAGSLSPTGLWSGRLLYGENRSVPIWVRVRITDAESGKLIAAPASSAGPAINRGQTVRVEVTSGGVLLAFDAAAESSGHIGEAVTVRNPANGQRFRAIVEAKGKAGIRK